MNARLVLASASPRRKWLLEGLGLSFRVLAPDADESVLAGESPEAYATRLSILKARSVGAGLDLTRQVVLAADTAVVLDEDILGKPESREHGLAMLAALSGATHRVVTGVSIVDARTAETFCATTAVTFRELDRTEIECYWRTGEPLDKAGGYGLQGAGAAFVSSLGGSYTNVIGLPLSETVVALRRFGVSCLTGAEPAPV